MHKTKYQELKDLCVAINKQIARLGGTIGYDVGHRYDYYALDIINLKTGGVKDTYRAGLTKNNCADILFAVSKILDNLERERVP